jgi:hypothetical protein
MGLLDRARQDLKQITSNDDEFAVEMIWTATDNSTCTVNGLHSKPFYSADFEGNVSVNSMKGHVSVHEENFTDQSYPTRNGNGEIDFTGHRVKVKDSTGEEKEYIVKQWYPNETFGLLVFVLDSYE